MIKKRAKKLRRRFFIKIRPMWLLILTVLSLFLISAGVLVSQGNAFWDSMYWAACSLTWSACETTVLYTPAIKFLSIVNGLATIVVVLVLLFTLGERILGIDVRGIRMKKRIETLKGHFIVCGFGRVGEHVCNILEENGVDYVVIEKKKDIIDTLKERGVLTIHGDATDPRVIEKAGMPRARGLIAAMGSDSDNVFAILAAKEINPELLIATRAHSEAAVKRLHRAGAEIVVLPEVVGGLELGKEILRLGGTYKERLISKEIS